MYKPFRVPELLWLCAHLQEQLAHLRSRKQCTVLLLLLPRRPGCSGQARQQQLELLVRQR